MSPSTPRQPAPTRAETVGNVKWFDVRKGFGFIEGPDGQDVFVHFTAVAGDGFRTLKDGERVAYELCEGEKGYNAQQVRRLDYPQKDQTADGRLDGTANAGNLPTARLGRQQKRAADVRSVLRGADDVPQIARADVGLEADDADGERHSNGRVAAGRGGSRNGD